MQKAPENVVHVGSVLYSMSSDAIKRPKLAFCCTLRYSRVFKTFLLCIMWCCCESCVLLCKRVVLIFVRVEVCLGEVIYGAVVLLVRLLELNLFPGQTDTDGTSVHTLCFQTSQRLKIKCLLNLFQQNK